ncbi:MAG: hypothetical protein ACOC16_00590 [Nanoarchaeota archaeon]
MRRFIVYSKNASTSPIIRDLKSAGRIDVLLHSIISALFCSNTFRNDVELHLILMGPPSSPRHITIKYDVDNTISKKNLKKLIEIALKKARKNEVRKVHPGVFVDDKNIVEIVEGIQEETKNIYLLDTFGEHIFNINKQKDFENPVFILGDHEGLDKQIKKYLKKNVKRLSLGSKIYFTSQSITILNYELDNL